MLKFFFYHPDFTVGSGISPDQSRNLKVQALGVADFTAGRELLIDCSINSPCPEEILIYAFRTLLNYRYKIIVFELTVLIIFNYPKFASKNTLPALKDFSCKNLKDREDLLALNTTHQLILPDFPENH